MALLLYAYSRGANLLAPDRTATLMVTAVLSIVALVAVQRRAAYRYRQ